MTRFISPLAIAAWAVCGLLAQSVEAQTLQPTERYRFLPRQSVLNETGGFAGVDVDYRVMGTFGFTVDPVSIAIWPPERSAKFSNVNAWASHPILAFVLPLDQTLNLSELTGKQLPVAAPFDVYRFDGKTDDGSTVELYAAQIGPWLRLRGATTAPPGSADFFEYNLRAVARRTPLADFDGSDRVDGADLAKWSSRFGLKATSLDGLAQGDANGDGLTDGADFLAWQQQAGEEVPDVAGLDAMVDAALATLAAATSTTAAIPEPSSLGLAAVGLAFLALRRPPRSI
jgi:hypothetical protein